MTILERVVIIAITSIHFLTAWFKWMERKICALKQREREGVYPVFRKPKVTWRKRPAQLTPRRYSVHGSPVVIREGAATRLESRSWLMAELDLAFTPGLLGLGSVGFLLPSPCPHEPVGTTFLIPFKSWPDSFCHSARKKKKGKKTSSTMMQGKNYP